MRLIELKFQDIYLIIIFVNANKLQLRQQRDY